MPIIINYEKVQSNKIQWIEMLNLHLCITKWRKRWDWGVYSPTPPLPCTFMQLLHVVCIPPPSSTSMPKFKHMYIFVKLLFWHWSIIKSSNSGYENIFMSKKRWRSNLTNIWDDFCERVFLISCTCVVLDLI